MIYLFILSIIINIFLLITAIRLKRKCVSLEGKIEYDAKYKYWIDDLPTNGRQPGIDMETEYDYNNLNK